MEIDTVGTFSVDRKVIRMEGFLFQLEENESDIPEDLLELQARLEVFKWVSQLISREIADVQVELIRIKSKDFQ